jgi:peptidoglycan/xylan/chitin deacetylase (PgdA/CDA1 family)
MRRSVFLAGLVLAVSACTGARGVAPHDLPTAIDPIETSGVTVLGPVSKPRLVLVADPVAVPSTTTSTAVVLQTVPLEGVDPTTTTSSSSTTTTTVALAPVEAGFSTEPAPGTVALTFDDGPFDGWTDTILDVLDAHAVTATFFISTYRLPTVAHLIPVIVERGHSVQTHGDRHDNLTQKTEEEIRADIATSIDKLVAAGAPRPTCFRPPYGATNEVVNRVAAEFDLQVIGWTLNSLDYSLQDEQGVTDTVLTYVTDGDNILMHDQWAPIWEPALPVVINEIRNRGLDFSPICLPSA